MAESSISFRDLIEANEELEDIRIKTLDLRLEMIEELLDCLEEEYFLKKTLKHLKELEERLDKHLRSEG